MSASIVVDMLPLLSFEGFALHHWRRGVATSLQPSDWCMVTKKTCNTRASKAQEDEQMKCHGRQQVATRLQISMHYALGPGGRSQGRAILRWNRPVQVVVRKSERCEWPDQWSTVRGMSLRCTALRDLHPKYHPESFYISTSQTRIIEAKSDPCFRFVTAITHLHCAMRCHFALRRHAQPRRPRREAFAAWNDEVMMVYNDNIMFIYIYILHLISITSASTHY